MAFLDTKTGRLGILGWTISDGLPEADTAFTDIDAQVFLGLPAQHDIDNIPGTGGNSTENRGVRIGLGIGF